MKLTELDPRWFVAMYWDGSQWMFGRSGFTMLCPHCRETRLAVTTRPLKASHQFEALAALHPDNHGEIVPSKQNFAWQVVGDDFATLTVTPSVDASASGHWHGFITAGEIS